MRLLLDCNDCTIYIAKEWPEFYLDSVMCIVEEIAGHRSYIFVDDSVQLDDIIDKSAEHEQISFDIHSYEQLNYLIRECITGVRMGGQKFKIKAMANYITHKFHLDEEKRVADEKACAEVDLLHSFS